MSHPDFKFAHALPRPVCADARLSWRELQDRVARAASVLAQRGIRRGDRVALLLGNRAEFPLAFLGAAWLGAICVPIGIREQKPGLEYILRHCGASMLVYDAELAGRLPDGWFVESPRVTVDREEIIIVGELPGLEGDFVDDAAKAAANAAATASSSGPASP